MAIWEWIKSLILGVLEGVTEWLPISSTGHLLLLDGILNLNESSGFKEVFFIVIQLGAILAVLVIFWDQITPFRAEGGVVFLQKNAISLWLKIAVACIPGAVITLLWDDDLDAFLSETKLGGQIPLKPVVIAGALIGYGVLFLFLEFVRKSKTASVNAIKDIRFSDALVIGLFQALSIVPGTSRSGSCVIGATCLGISRPIATEFTFFLAIPVMLGYSLIKLLRFGLTFSADQLLLLLLGTGSAFLTSLFVIRLLTSYVKKHGFSVFGIYRILLGIAVLLFYLPLSA